MQKYRIEFQNVEKFYYSARYLITTLNGFKLY